MKRNEKLFLFEILINAISAPVPKENVKTVYEQGKSEIYIIFFGQCSVSIHLSIYYYMLIVFTFIINSEKRAFNRFGVVLIIASILLDSLFFCWTFFVSRLISSTSSKIHLTHIQNIFLRSF